MWLFQKIEEGTQQKEQIFDKSQRQDIQIQKQYWNGA